MIRVSSRLSTALAFALLVGCSGTESSHQPGANTGGTIGTSGTDVVGGTLGGGADNTGGVLSTGGTTSGALITGGALSSGGASPTGGAASAGGVSPTGGAASAGGGNCARTVGACTAPAVNVTPVTLNAAAQAAAGTSDTANIPLALAAKPSGGSRLAWLGTDNNIHVAELDCSDNLVGTPFTIPGIDLEDIYADDSGGVVLLTRNATNGGTDNCGTGTLCGGTSSPCKAMWLVRFTASGTVQWETQVTNLSASLAGYQNGARFVWWYQHHGRIAFDGTNYAAYFGVAITVNNGSCVDIHEGDRLQVVGPAGALVAAKGFDFGCSHAWTSRIVWDSRVNQFITVCATDNNCRIARSPNYTTVATSTCDGNLFNGDLVNGSAAGYWDAWANAGQVALQHFTSSGSDTAITGIVSNLHPHLVTYGASNMLLAWGASNTVTAQVRDSGSGALIGSQFTIAVNEQPYQAWKSYPDGSVAYPAYSTSTSVKIARVMPCQ